MSASININLSGSILGLILTPISRMRISARSILACDRFGSDKWERIWQQGSIYAQKVILTLSLVQLERNLDFVGGSIVISLFFMLIYQITKTGWIQKIHITLTFVWCHFNDRFSCISKYRDDNPSASNNRNSTSVYKLWGKFIA